MKTSFLYVVFAVSLLGVITWKIERSQQPVEQEAMARPRMASAPAQPVEVRTDEPSPGDGVRFAPEPSIRWDRAEEDAVEAEEFDPHEDRSPDARVVSAVELRWLSLQLTKARTAANKVAHGRERAVLDKLASEAHWRIRYQRMKGKWPSSVEEVDRLGCGDYADKAFWLASMLLRAGIQDVSLQVGVPQDYVPGEEGHAWVVVRLRGVRYALDPATNDQVVPWERSPLASYQVVATATPRQS